MSANLTAPAETVAELTDDRNDQVLTLVGDKTPCNCHDDCPQLTGRYFAQGHDARLVTRLRAEVLADKLTTQEAFAEILRRGGTERLQIKLDAAVTNARSKPARKAARKGKKAKVTTFELDGFQLVTPPRGTEPARAKVGRWTYEGVLRTHLSAEEGAEKSDTFLVFEFTNKAGELVETLKFREAERLAEVPADEAEPEVSQEVAEVLPNTAAEAALEEVAQLTQAEAGTPF